MLKYLNSDIVFQEVPDETSLAINITGCPCGCPGCHSPYLWADTGRPLDANAIDCLMAEHGKSITCICFMGGDGAPKEVAHLAQHLHKHTNLKVAWYSGNDTMPATAKQFDYVKVGGYKHEYGGLKSKTTNQRLYHNINGKAEDITSRFWR
jgi:anaerobic ribonucleoside-triphosphate reductase activating protein